MKTPKPEALLATGEGRFAKHPKRHAGMAWADVLARLEGKPAALKQHGGEEPH